MLVDSRPGIVQVLPALSSEWPTGSVRGVGTRAGVRVEKLRWDLREGVVRVVLTSGRERDVIVACRTGAAGRQSVRLTPYTPVMGTIPLG